MLSETIDQTYPHLSAALDGVARFSDTIGKRDEEIKQLLANANKVAGVLGDRSEQINRLLVNAKTLLAAFNERGQAIDALLGTCRPVLRRRCKGFINDNPNLNHVLEQLRTISDMLVERKDDLADALTTLSKFTASLAEAIASGPYFKVHAGQPAARTGSCSRWSTPRSRSAASTPEEFWRSAGLPAFRFPDPNGTRFPNGAPPPAPPVLEGTPEHPGPAVPPGSPCSYTPAGGRVCRGPAIRCPARTCRPGPVRRQPVLDPAPHSTCDDVAAEPGRPAACTPGVPERRPAGRAAAGRAAAHRCRCRPAPPGARTDRSAPAGPAPDLRRHRAAAACARRTAAAAGTGAALRLPVRRSRQPAVPPAGSQNGR